jgi:outer membrane protein assembly factor BamA
VVFSQEEEIDEIDRQMELWSRIEDLFEKQKERGLIVLPVGFSNPTIGAGVGGAARYLYKLDEESKASHTTFGAAWAGNDGWVAGLLQRTFLKADRYRIDGEVGLFDVSRSYYGTGFDSGEAGDFIDLDQVGYLFKTRALIQAGENLYLGVHYRLIRMETGSDIPGVLDSGVHSIPTDERDAVSSGIGPIFRLDSRDNIYNPYSGTLLELTSYAADEMFGSDFDYQSLQIKLNQYVEVGQDQVLAFALSGCFASGDVPYYDLCSFGQSSNLRGYVSGRYRDRNMLTAQLEYRGQFHDRWGVVAFAGTGEVAPDLDGFNGEDLLPSAGAGLRLMVSRKQRINVGFDYAVGKDEEAWYLRFGEAF